MCTGPKLGNTVPADVVALKVVRHQQDQWGQGSLACFLWCLSACWWFCITSRIRWLHWKCLTKLGQSCGTLSVNYYYPGVCGCDSYHSIHWGLLQDPKSSQYPSWKSHLTYRKISNIRRTKYPNLNVSHLALQLSLPNPMKPGVKLRMKMSLEQRWQVMLQLHLSDRQFYCLLRCGLY